MKLFKSIFKHKKGSQLVEKILMTAFAVAGGGAVVVYGSNVLTNAKNTEITGILSGSGQMSQEELNAHFNDSTRTITLTVSELSNKTFTNLANIECTSDAFFQTTAFYNGKTYTADDFWQEKRAFNYTFSDTQNDSFYNINFQWGGEYGGSNDLGSCKWNFGYYTPSTDWQNGIFEEEVTLNLGSLYEIFKSALIADLS